MLMLSTLINNKGALVFYFIIALQVAAALLPIRNWPLTDYPMFSQTVETLQPIAKITFANVYPDRVSDWERSDYVSVGFNSARLQNFAADPHNPEVLKFLKERVQLHKLTSEKPLRIVLKKTTYMLDESGNTLVTSFEDIESFNYADLEN